jgi:hypothetical protein
LEARDRKSEYYFSRHGDQERQNDNLTISEVVRVKSEVSGLEL